MNNFSYNMINILYRSLKYYIVIIKQWEFLKLEGKKTSGPSLIGFGQINSVDLGVPRPKGPARREKGMAGCVLCNQL